MVAFICGAQSCCRRALNEAGAFYMPLYGFPCQNAGARWLGGSSPWRTIACFGFEVESEQTVATLGEAH